MAMLTLGLDLGIASIGWALISEEDSKITLKAWGSRIFTPGMDDDVSAGKGTSRNADRRMKRALRIQLRRRRMRKNLIIKVLTDAGLLPKILSDDFFVSMDKRMLATIQESDRTRSAHLLPYLYRKAALDRPLEPYELGRALFHLAQHRGFLSNRKADLKADEKSIGIVKEGIQTLKNDMQTAGARTLGEYFSTLNPEEERIRSRYTERSMYLAEFEQICDAQKSLISDELRKKLHNAIFYQRPLKSCKNLIGVCSMDSTQKRCSYLCEEAQVFRIFTTLSNLRIKNKLDQLRELTDTERATAFFALNGFSDAVSARGKMTLTALAKYIGLPKGEKFTLGENDKEIFGNVLHACLFAVFGEQAEQMPQEMRDKFFHDMNSINKTDALRRRLAGYWHLSDDKIDIAMKLPIPDDYCSVSKKVIREIMPDLEANIPLSKIKATKYPESHVSHYDTLPLVDEIDFLKQLRNPVVHRTLTELRTVVNAVIARYGKPNCIRIELARDLKANNKEREKMIENIQKREKERAAIAKRIVEETNIANPSRTDILKVMLAQESDFTCPYTGRRFSMNELLTAGVVDIEHIIPYSRSYDDSIRNKTLCEANENRRVKRERTPFEAYGGTEAYREMLARVKQFKSPYAKDKLDRFQMEEIDESDFLARDLNDTRYASKAAMRYLGALFGGIYDADGKQHIFATQGTATAMIRRVYGFNYLLGEGEKVRDDHRHHAIDALVIALTNPGIVQHLAKMSTEERKNLSALGDDFVDVSLKQQAWDKLDSVAVSHHTLNKIRGAFHKETIYGKDFGNQIRHTRVALSELSQKDIAQIVDPAIRKAVLDALDRSDYEIQSMSEKEFKELLRKFNNPENLPVLRNQNGIPVNTVKKVRIARKVTTITLGTGDSARNVANGENYVLALYEDAPDKKGKIRWSCKVVSLLEAKQHLLKHEPLFDKNIPGKKFLFSLQKGDIVSIDKDGKTYLCIIRGISDPLITCTPVREARLKKDIMNAGLWFVLVISTLGKWNIKKYNMNIFGELTNAND